MLSLRKGIGRLFGRKDRIQQRAWALGELGLEYGAPLLQQIVDSVVEGLGYKGALLALLNKEGDRLELKAHRVEPQALIDAGYKLTPWRFETGRVLLKDSINIGAKSLRENKVITTHDLYELFGPMVPREVCKVMQGMSGIKTMVSLPFMVDDTPVGNLYAASVKESISEAELKALRGFGNMASVAVMHLMESITLQNLIGDVQSTISVEEVFQKVVDDVVEGLGYRAAMLAQVDVAENKLVLKAWHIEPQSLIEAGNKLTPWRLETGEVSLEDKVNIGATVLRERGKPCEITHDLYRLLGPMVPRPACATLQRLAGIKTMVTVPFRVENEPVGNLYVASEREHIGESAIRSLRAFADQAAVAVRNAELFKDTQKLAVMSFAATKSVHSLNNRLGIIWAGLEDDADDEDRKDARQYHKEAVELVQSLRNPYEAVKEGPTDVNVSLKTALADVKRNVGIPAHIRIECQYGESLPLVKASEMLTKAFRILVKNAVEAMLSKEEGSLRITSSLQEIDRRPHIVIAISDTGEGIPPHIRRQMFRLGFTTKEGQGGRKRGLGFGLWWIKLFIVWIQGDLKFDGEEGKGTTFTITLPVMSE